jgi:hypothetical protein
VVDLGEGLSTTVLQKDWVQRIEGAKIKEIRFNNPAHRWSLSDHGDYKGVFVTVNVDTAAALSPFRQSR